MRILKFCIYRALTPLVHFLDRRTTHLVRSGASVEVVSAAGRLELRAVRFRSFFRY